MDMDRKEEILEYTKYILYKTPQGFPLKKEDTEFLMSVVFPLHPKWKYIVGRIKLVVVKKNRYGSKYFSALLDDNTYTDLGIYECINRKGLREDIIEAARNAIVDIPPPPLKGRKKNRTEFSIIVKNWLKLLDGEELLAGKYLTDLPNGSKFFNSRELVDSFRAYYIQNG